MHEPDIEKLRRFALAVALILLTYSVAGVSLKPGSGISVMGLIFEVSRPGLLPIGLVIASICAMIRFYYYGFMLKKSPYCLRHDAIDNLGDPRYMRRKNAKGKIVNRVPVYLGPSKFETSIWEQSKEKAEEYCSRFPEVFPKFAGARSSAKIRPEQSFNEEGEPAGIRYTVDVEIPIRCRIAAVFEDIDYSSPIWLNLISLAIFFSRVWLYKPR